MSQEGLCHSLTALTATVITAYQKEDIVRYQYVKIPFSLLPFPWHFLLFAANTPLHFKLIIDTSFQSKIYNKLNTLFSFASINLEEHKFYKSYSEVKLQWWKLQRSSGISVSADAWKVVASETGLFPGSKQNFSCFFFFKFCLILFFVLNVLVPLPFSWLDVNEILERIHIWGLIHTFSESK